MCVCAAGSGKTLAYLAPLISELKRVEEEEGVVSLLRRPRALILLPSRDLASQVLVSECFTVELIWTSMGQKNVSFLVRCPHCKSGTSG